MHTCKEAEEFRVFIELELEKFKRFIRSKNGHYRKNISDQKRKHWNALVKKHNEHVEIWNNRLIRLLES